MTTIRRLTLVLCFCVAAAAAHASGIVKGPYLQNPTTSAITVCWVSDGDSTGAVTYAQDGAATEWHRTVKDSKPTRYHKVRITGLKPYTLYQYTVECGGQTSGATFRTAAPADQPFRFVAYGDTRTQPRVHAAVIARMMLFHPDFVIQSGDLVANGANEGLWNQFWPVVEPLVKSTPYYPTLGNHEDGAAPYFRYFAVKRNYSFDYGNAHFASIDTNVPESEYAAQEEWLRKDLRDHQRATWRFVFCHHTPFTCVLIAGRREAAERLRARLEPILKEGHVQALFCGHDHNYQRHEKDGITYVVSGGGGAPLYDLKPDTPYVKVAKKVYNECEITVDGPDVSVRVLEPDGTVIDQFRLHAEVASARANSQVVTTYPVD